MAWIFAASESIHRFNAMYQPVFLQELQRPIHGGRFGLRIFALQFLQELIGGNDIVVTPDQLQDATAAGSKANASRQTNAISIAQGLGHATFVVVLIHFHNLGHNLVHNLIISNALGGGREC